MVDVYSKMKPDSFKSQGTSHGQALDPQAQVRHQDCTLVQRRSPLPLPPLPAAPAAEPATKDDTQPPPPAPEKPAPPTPPAGKKAKGGKGGKSD